MTTFEQRLQEKIIVFDGATGTNLQLMNLTPDDFGGEALAGCNEHLVFTRPDAVEKLHASFLAVGCDVIETDSFGATPIVLGEYGLADRAYEHNRRAAALAKKVAQQFSTPNFPRFVAGSMGPTTKLPSLGHIPFADMKAAYAVQTAGLVEGGVDLLVVETCQDLLQIKAALAAIFDYFAQKKVRVPVIASVTVETMGTMLLGSDIAAALTALEPFPLTAMGMNCATGPKEMSENIRYLTGNSRFPVFCMPNAGLPENIGGRAHYKLTPEELTHFLSHFVKDLGVQIVGGCCGTRPEHIELLAKSVGQLAPKSRQVDFVPSAASLYSSTPLHLDPPPLLIGERLNANGSKQFRDLLLKQDWEAMVAMAKAQVREGAHMLDVCTAYVGRDELADMMPLLERLNTQIAVPLLIDSTEWQVIEAALQRLAGRAIVNSINLEDGEERLSKVLPLCKKYGAATIALTIDEQGMAKTAEKKFAIAKRIHDLAVKQYGMRPQDLIFDCLTFTLGSGDEEFRRSGIETLEAIRRIKKDLPKCYTILGVSNVSFGLTPQARHALNSVFLYYAVEAGLDMAIVHASKIMPLHKIPEAERELHRRLVFDERQFDERGQCVSDPLQEILAFYAEKSVQPKEFAARPAAVEERLKRRIVDGEKVGLEADLNEALQKYAALDIINTILLEGMKTVGELFGSGQMQLPFVLQSAETMKTAVKFLEPHMARVEGASKGTMVLATVKGDVHDIGKNLVDIILSNNGYKVINLGIKVPIEQMLQAAQEHQADAIGMSGLLVKSTLIMKENLEVMNERGLTLPVVLGGAALTRRYVEEELRAIYRGTLVYAHDAFDGLHFMEAICGGGERKTGRAGDGKSDGEEEGGKGSAGERNNVTVPGKPGWKLVAIPTPPFLGTKVVRDIPLDEVFAYINPIALFRGQWQVRRGQMKLGDYKQLVEKKFVPIFEELKRRCIDEKLLMPEVVYGYFLCNSDNDDVILFDENGTRELERFRFPRQQRRRRLCIADFFAPIESGKKDVIGMMVVTVGHRASEISRHLFETDHYTDYLYFHGLSVETAEALAEYWHKKMREELGIGSDDAKDLRELFQQGYRGSRYSFGYPACPNLEDQAKLFRLLDPSRINISLTEEFQLVPEQSTSAIVVHHPQAKYFTVKEEVLS
ncbi:MAG: methionine synthase [candidate division KSB1 bacterium]|nr:methionine synthase [candidate division KSB1 bacterium]